MSSLNNFVTATGDYNNIPTSLTSNSSVVNLIDGLNLTIEADQPNWVMGELTYIITLTNNTTTAYEQPIIKDTLNTTLVDFVSGSVEINGSTLEQSKYTYIESTGLLTINLDDVGPSSNVVLTFRVTKKS